MTTQKLNSIWTFILDADAVIEPEKIAVWFGVTQIEVRSNLHLYSFCYFNNHDDKLEIYSIVLEKNKSVVIFMNALVVDQNWIHVFCGGVCPL